MSIKRSKPGKISRVGVASIVITLFAFGVFVGGCGNNESTSVPISQEAVAIKKKIKYTVSQSLKARQIHHKKQQTAKTVKPSALKVKNGKGKIIEVHYRSNIAKLRDPFVPFIKFETEKNLKLKANKHLLPLQKYTLSQLRLIAIIDAGKKGRWAMVCDASGKGYTVREGMPIGSEGGIIEKILPDRIVVKKTRVDLLGKKKISFAALKLHPEKKGE